MIPDLSILFLFFFSEKTRYHLSICKWKWSEENWLQTKLCIGYAGWRTGWQPKLTIIQTFNDFKRPYDVLLDIVRVIMRLWNSVCEWSLNVAKVFRPAKALANTCTCVLELKTATDKRKDGIKQVLPLYHCAERLWPKNMCLSVSISVCIKNCLSLKKK